MADRLKRSSDHQLAEIDTFLLSELQARRMNPSEQSREGRLLAGWITSLTIAEQRFGIRIVLRPNFPLSAPEILLEDPSFYLKFPHVERTGKLCLLPSSATFSPASGKKVIEHLLERATQLLEDSVAGRNLTDFADEFQSYWPGTLPKAGTPFLSILSETCATREICVWEGSKFNLFGDTEAECRSWLKNFHGKESKTFRRTVLLWLPTCPIPPQYPRTAADFRSFATTPEAQQLLLSVIPKEPRNLPVLFGFETSAGRVYAGLLIKEPKSRTIVGGTNRNSRGDGFRPGKLPSDILLSRYYGSSVVLGADVQRADPEWIHIRGGGMESTDLRRKKVGILGCGSLGADIAILLAKSGVGNFLLVDDQKLLFDNIGRHLLGATFVGEGKAASLDTFLKEQLPSVKVTSIGTKIESVIRERPAVLTELDLIICTTGDWPSELALNLAARDWPDFPPVIFGWTEPYGIAGHALLVNSSGGCLVCGTSEHGVFRKRVTEWPSGKKTLLRGAGCGEFYQPYGVSDVAPIKAMIVDLAVSFLRERLRRSVLRTWIGDVSRLKGLGATINNSWVSRFEAAEEGNRMFAADWDKHPECPLCE